MLRSTTSGLCAAALLGVLGAAITDCRPPQAPAPQSRAAYLIEDLLGIPRISEVAVSPSGDELAFVSDRDGNFELYTARLAGSPLALENIRQRTRLAEHVSDIEYGADGSTIIFAVDHGGDARQDIWILRDDDAPRALWTTPVADERPHVSPNGKMVVFQAEREGLYFDTAIGDLSTGTVKRVLTDSISIEEPVWSRDGRFVFASKTGDHQRGTLLTYDTVSGESKEYLPPVKDGVIWAWGSLITGQIVVTATNAQGFLQVGLLDPKTGQTHFRGPGDWDVERVRIDSKDNLHIVRNVHGETEVARIDANDVFASLARRGVMLDFDVAAGGDRVAVVIESANEPAQIVVLGPGGRRDLAWTPPSNTRVRVDQLSRAELKTFRSFDGRDIDTYVYLPPVERLGSPPPVLLSPHGGPSWQSRPYFKPDILALTEAGFAVVQPNYRGSTGYGRPFEDLNDRDWGGADIRDLLAALDSLGASVDLNRQGVVGASYGGYLTLRSAIYAPDRFRVAVDMFGFTDFTKMPPNDPFWQKELGSDQTFLRERSPIFTSERLKVPLLVLHGKNDPEISVAGSERLVAMLRARHAMVDFHIYPNEGHGFERRENRIDAQRRILEWLTRYLGQNR